MIAWLSTALRLLPRALMFESSGLATTCQAISVTMAPGREVVRAAKAVAITLAPAGTRW